MTLLLFPVSGQVSSPTRYSDETAFVSPMLHDAFEAWFSMPQDNPDEVNPKIRGDMLRADARFALASYLDPVLAGLKTKAAPK